MKMYNFFTLENQALKLFCCKLMIETEKNIFKFGRKNTLLKQMVLGQENFHYLVLSLMVCYNTKLLVIQSVNQRIVIVVKL